MGNWEETLVEYCAPTLAGLKTAGLFRYFYQDEVWLLRLVRRWNQKLSLKGVEIMILKKWEGRALLYMFRREKLRGDLQKPGVLSFLADYGYQSGDVDSCLLRLRDNFGEYDVFPHEIGIFLGYPLADVKGFITHSGRDCKCVGWWKVYGDLHEAVSLFARYEKCKDVYKRLLRNGRSIMQLTVAV